MDKKMILRLIIPDAIFLAVVFALLKVIPATQESFAWYTLTWACFIIALAAGVRYLLGGIFAGSNVILKKISICFGAVLLVAAFLFLTWAIVMPQDIILPIIGIIVVLAMIISILVTGGRKWDAGDNQKVGYKNYHQRKAEADKQAKKSAKQ